VKLADVVEKLALEVRTGDRRLDTEVTGGYSSDLMSDVIANGKKGNVWVTLQVHQNIVAVASVNDLAGIVLVKGREPEQEAIEMAEVEGMPILVTQLPTFEVVGRLYQLGISGMPVTGASQQPVQHR
jgi:predicted transcriptional regulator